MAEKEKKFDYNGIPLGFYDDIALHKSGMRSFWHNQKFKRVIDCFTEQQGSILDIGCFSGTFLGMIPENIFSEQVGVDILKDQIEFANKQYAKSFRKFQYVKTIRNLNDLPENYFNCVTIIEVIEHLSKEEIIELLSIAGSKLKQGGKLIVTTPNYFSIWPLLELILNLTSKVKYQEQHITKFSSVRFLKKIGSYIDDFDQKFNLDFTTTTHSISPYIALFSYKLAEKLSSKVKHKNWHFPFGSLILTVMIKK